MLNPFTNKNQSKKKKKKKVFPHVFDQHIYTSSVEKHMLANQKVRGSILSLAELSFCCPVQIYTTFYTEIIRENTS